jgi:signal-transduction protein with cAMP-binding, CBS, and nucleotidyltransferase domain
MDTKKRLHVKDIMNRDVVVLPADGNVQDAAKRMRDEEIGSVIIVDPNQRKQPIGILTERDMNNRIVAENKLANEIKCKEIMSSPVVSISPDVDITEAMHQMATQHIKRLIVMKKQEMVGIISQSDILQIAPYMIEILQEMAEIRDDKNRVEYMAGYCQLCENWSDMLIEEDEIFICPDCKNSKKDSSF